jgi:hypothetical protein
MDIARSHISSSRRPRTHLATAALSCRQERDCARRRGDSCRRRSGAAQARKFR